MCIYICTCICIPTERVWRQATATGQDASTSEKLSEEDDRGRDALTRMTGAGIK